MLACDNILLSHVIMMDSFLCKYFLGVQAFTHTDARAHAVSLTKATSRKICFEPGITTETNTLSCEWTLTVQCPLTT